MKQIVLKPCPFCGEKPWLGKWPLALDKSPDDYQCSIECENPECGAAIISSCFEEASIQETQWKMEVIKRWNNRYESTAYASLADAIQKDIEYAWGWHCNIAGNIEHEGIEPIKANKIAARLMELMFGVDTTKHVAYPTGDKEFQEPVDEHLRSVQKRKDTVWDAVRLAYHEYDGGGIKGTRAEYIGNKALKAFNDSPTSDTKPSVESPENYCCPNKCEEKSPDHLVDTNKMVEKEALKLRVGGVYKSRIGNIKKIIDSRINHLNKKIFLDEFQLVYFEDGRFLYSDDRDIEHNWDLIEEVLSEKNDVEKSTIDEKDMVEYCEHSLNTIMFHHDKVPSCMLCDKPLKPSLRDHLSNSGDKKTAEPESIEYLQRRLANALKENFTLKEHYGELKERLATLEKTEGNPFKVGNKVIAFLLYGAQGAPSVSQGEVMEISGNKIYISDSSGVWNAYHYKQCEKVDEEN